VGVGGVAVGGPMTITTGPSRIRLTHFSARIFYANKSRAKARAPSEAECVPNAICK